MIQNREFFLLNKDFRVFVGGLTHGGAEMQKTHFNIQDQFLNQCRKARIEVEVVLLSGDSFKGYVRSFDNFCIIVEQGTDIISLVYKHAISMLRPVDPGTKVPGIA